MFAFSAGCDHIIMPRRKKYLSMQSPTGAVSPSLSTGSGWRSGGGGCCLLPMQTLSLASSSLPSSSSSASSSFLLHHPAAIALAQQHGFDAARLEEVLRSPLFFHFYNRLTIGGCDTSVTEDELRKAKCFRSSTTTSAFREVAEIKLIVNQLVAAGNTQNNAAALAALLHAANLEGPSHNNNNGTMSGQNGTSSRKRSANFSIGPTQPECPVALRPAISNCNISSPFLPWPNANAAWNSIFAQTLRTSPTLPGGPPQTSTSEPPTAAGEQKQWSSPSSVDSGPQKTDSSGGESNIDPVGIDGSESSSTSSTCTQAMMSSPPIQQQFTADVLAFAAAAAQNGINGMSGMNGQFDMKQVSAIPMQSTVAHPSSIQPERKPRKQISDDYVKLIRQHDLSGKKISDIQIPVQEALEIDPTFVAISEQQIVQQLVQSKKFEEMDAKDATTQLCKKLAEKRVFGPRLMANTTVAGPNHSTYNNLPDEGIIYIQHVCRQVLKDKVHSEEEFWDVFREAMRKLAARCRRVRHAKKTKSMRETVVALSQSDPLSFLKREPIQEWADTVRLRAQNAASPNLPAHTDLNNQMTAALPAQHFDYVV